MSQLTVLRLNMTNVADPSTRHRAALEMAEYADGHGFTAVSGEEHHPAATGWLPSPLILAAALAGRTRNVRISINALIVPLYDPVRLAEDVAVLDNLAQGRFGFVAGMGYRPEEYHAAGRGWSRRAALMDECLGVLIQAWGDEPFDYRGTLVNVTPKPCTRPHPVSFVGGMTVAAAPRAARFGLPFSPPMAMPDRRSRVSAGAERARQNRVRPPPRERQHRDAAARRSRRSLDAVRRVRDERDRRIQRVEAGGGAAAQRNRRRLDRGGLGPPSAMAEKVLTRVSISAWRSDRAAWSVSPRCPRRWSCGRR
ncbi:LLM class flavin-dependent oxidoreductase [Mycobacterium servetii]|uniref:LLM class flavin-dependent oxidoreductase n=1 Tax=Mycobacterium servetii TaxID=3237418 RepID=A0ABV4C813_9MYCO